MKLWSPLRLVILLGLLVSTIASANPEQPAITLQSGKVTSSIGSAKQPWLSNGQFIVRDANNNSVSLGDLSSSKDSKTGELTLTPSKQGIGVFQINWDSTSNELYIRFKPQRNGMTASFEADVRWGDKPLLCRIAPESSPQMIQLAYGPAESSRCNVLFDPQTDSALSLETPGAWKKTSRAWKLNASGSSETIARIKLIQDYYKVSRKVPFFKALDRSIYKLPPAGWCSWYYYYTWINEDEMVKNAEWLEKNLKPFGCEYVQLDDGYQTDTWTDWNNKFSHGGKWLVDQIHQRGMKAGLWLTPYATDEKALVEQHPDWFIHSKNGDTVRTFKANYTIDASNPAVLEGWLKPMYKTLALDWGFDYFKQDGQTTVTDAYHKTVFHKPGIDPDEAYRSGLNAIREVIGDHRFLLSCWGTPLEGVGIVNGSRTGGDVGADWAGVQPAYSATKEWLYLNNIGWYCDPDVLCVRPPLTKDQAQLWATLLGLTGQLLMTSDKMYELPEDRVEILKRVYPVADITPMDLYPYKDSQMNMMDLKVAKPFGSWDVLALYNWTYDQKSVRLNSEQLGLPNNPGGYILYDYWNKRCLGILSEETPIEIPATACRLLAVHPFLNRPQVISTSRHVTQGAMDLKSLQWDSKNLVLKGVSQLVENDPYEIRIACPFTGASYKAISCSAKETPSELGYADGTTLLTLKSPVSREVSWEVRFEKQDRIAAAPKAPKALETHTTRIGCIDLNWKPAEDQTGIAYYVVYQDGKEVARVTGEACQIGKIEYQKNYTFQVKAVNLAGLESPLSEMVQTTTPKPKDAYLTEFMLQHSMQEFGSPMVDRSVAGATLRIGDKTYEHGIGSHSNAELEYHLGGYYSRFEAEVGVDIEVSEHGSVSFEVWGDGKKLYDSDLMVGREAPKKVNVDIRGVRTLVLRVGDGRNGNSYDHADWAEARVFVE